MIIEKVSISSLSNDPSNLRRHNDKNIAAVKASLQRFGQQRPIVVSRNDVVIAGNCTLTAAQQLGWQEIEITRTDLAGIESIAFSIADNRTAELAEWDDAELARVLTEIAKEDILEGIGFEDKELAKLVATVNADAAAGLIDPDDVPLPPDEAKTKPGDLWILGNHRLLCGDSSLAGDVDRLVSGAKIHLCNSDPPYNVKVEPRSNNAIAAGLSSFKGSTHHQKLDVARHPSKSRATHSKLRAKDRPLANDFLPEEAFDRLLRVWFGNISRVLDPGRAFYIWGGYANLGNYPPALRECGLYFSQGIVWDKQHPVLTRKDCMGAFEIAFYGWREGAAHKYFGPNNATDLWAVKKVNPQSMIHLTEKPVELARRAIRYSSRPRENVLDLFGGSGSTLIAAEQEGRNAFLMEIDTLYCDVIVDRWEKFTGKKADLECETQNAK